MASLFWWRNEQLHPNANTSREGNTLLPACSCLGQGWESHWLILRQWEPKDRHNISGKPSGLLWFFSLGSQERSERCYKELIQALFAGRSSLLERNKLNPSPLSPFSFPSLLEELPLFPLEDPISFLHSCCAPTPLSNLKTIKFWETLTFSILSTCQALHSLSGPEIVWDLALINYEH